MRYTDEEELLFKSCGEKAEAMSILHQMAHVKYTRWSVMTNVPVILISSAVGFVTTIRIFSNQEIMLGILSILVGFVKSMDSYFSFTTRSEAHRMVGLSYGRIANLINIQLTLAREDRIKPEDLLSVVTNDVTSLRDSEPIIDDDIVTRFNKRYATDLTAKPSIVAGLTAIKIYEQKTSEAAIQVCLSPPEPVADESDRRSVTPAPGSGVARMAKFRPPGPVGV